MTQSTDISALDFLTEEGRFVVNAHQLYDIPVERIREFEQIMRDRLESNPHLVLETYYDRDYMRYEFVWYTKKVT